MNIEQDVKNEEKNVNSMIGPIDCVSVRVMHKNRWRIIFIGTVAQYSAKAKKKWKITFLVGYNRLH